jgi:hypothetical protein
MSDATTTATIHIALLDEGVSVWRPTQADRLPDGSYRVLATPDYDPADERWQFPPGSRVVCEPKRLPDGEVLAAVRLAPAGRQSA